MREKMIEENPSVEKLNKEKMREEKILTESETESEIKKKR